MTEGWAKKRASVLKSVHFFEDIDKPSLCRMAPFGEKILDTHEAMWECDVCKRLYKDRNGG
jgi:hypothetical protein